MACSPPAEQIAKFTLGESDHWANALVVTKIGTMNSFILAVWHTIHSFTNQISRFYV